MRVHQGKKAATKAINRAENSYTIGGAYFKETEGFELIVDEACTDPLLHSLQWEYQASSGYWYCIEIMENGLISSPELCPDYRSVGLNVLKAAIQKFEDGLEGADSHRARYLKVAQAYDLKALEIAERDADRVTPYGDQQTAVELLDLADRFYQLAGTSREEVQ